MKYLGVKTDGKLNWKDQNYDTGTKLDRVIALLYKIRIFVNFNPLKAIYFAIFVSHVNYANLIKGQKPNPKLWINTLQKKALITINNQPRNSHSGPLFKKSNTLKFEDKILISKIYIILISKSINNLLPLIFKNWFIFCSKIHNYDTVSLPTDKMFKPSYRTDSYGKNYIIVTAEIKPRTFLGVSDLNLFTQPKLKTYLHKDASTNINNLLKY